MFWGLKWVYSNFYNIFKVFMNENKLKIRYESKNLNSAFSITRNYWKLYQLMIYSLFCISIGIWPKGLLIWGLTILQVWVVFSTGVVMVWIWFILPWLTIKPSYCIHLRGCIFLKLWAHISSMFWICTNDAHSRLPNLSQRYLSNKRS